MQSQGPGERGDCFAFGICGLCELQISVNTARKERINMRK